MINQNRHHFKTYCTWLTFDWCCILGCNGLWRLMSSQKTSLLCCRYSNLIAHCPETYTNNQKTSSYLDLVRDHRSCSEELRNLPLLLGEIKMQCKDHKVVFKLLFRLWVQSGMDYCYYHNMCKVYNESQVMLSKICWI